MIFGKEHSPTFEALENLLLHEDALRIKDKEQEEQEEALALQHNTMVIDHNGRGY